MISVNIVTRNRAHLLSRAIKSILDQTFKNIEIIIIDDDSSDNTEKIVKNFKNDKIRYYKIKKANTLGDARNIGLEKSNGKYIAILDDDDYWIDNRKLEKQYKILEEKKYILTGGGANLINSKNEIIGKIIMPTKNIKKKITNYCPFIHSTVMFNKKLALKVNGYKKINTAEDYYLWLKLVLLGNIHNSNEIFINYMTKNYYNPKKEKRNKKTAYKTVKPFFNKYPNNLKNWLIWKYKLLK